MVEDQHMQVPRKRVNHQSVITHQKYGQKKRTVRIISFAAPKAMEIRHAAKLDFDKNTKKVMYGKNPLYKTLCIYCNKNFSGSIVQHYVKNHPDNEVPISRLSPQMAKQLKKQKEIFEQSSKNKISGLCYFCEEKQRFLKFGWQRHLISHTGEKLYNCTHCELKTKNEHGKTACKGKVANVFESNKDGSLIAFMCNDCNYIQFSHGRLLDHLRNQHGIKNPSIPQNYMELVVVKLQNT